MGSGAVDHHFTSRKLLGMATISHSPRKRSVRGSALSRGDELNVSVKCRPVLSNLTHCYNSAIYFLMWFLNLSKCVA